LLKDLLILTIFPGAMAVAAVTDLLTRKVPNRLILAFSALFFFVAPLAGLGLHDIGLHVALALAALAFAFVLFSFELMGGGDAKLFAATCLWLGPEAILAYTIYAALIGGVLALLLLFWRGLPLPVILASKDWLTRLHSPQEGVPYGFALAASGLLVFPGTSFVSALGG
jgi:prepilin peptidase CpaA